MFRPLRVLQTVLVISTFPFTNLAGAQKTAPRSTPPQVIGDFNRSAEPNIDKIAYQAYDKKLLTFSSKPSYVLVPVVVTGKDGKPVTGLTKEAFRVQENGKDRTIASVDEFVPTTTPLAVRPNGDGETTNQSAIQDQTPRRLIIIALDMVNTPFFDQVRARHQIISYLSDRLEPGSLYQIVAVENNGLRVLHDYTQDTAELINTLKSVRSRFSARDAVDTAALKDFAVKTDGNVITPGATTVGPSAVKYVVDPKVDFEAFAAAKDAQAERPYAEAMVAAAASSTLVAFQQIAERVSGVPGRKSLIWITGGFPFSIDPGTASVSDGVVFGVYQHVMEELSNQMIAVYPVDARGLLTDSVDASVHLNRPQNSFPQALVNDEANRQLDVLTTMRAFADMTGGYAYVNTNDTSGAVHDAAQDGAQYYLLSYPLDKNDRRPGWRKIAVKVGDYHVRARKGYFLTQATVDPLASAKYDIEAALTSPLDYTGLPLRVRLKPEMTGTEKRRVTFSMSMPPKVVTVDSTDNNHVFLDIAYVVLTATGDSASQKNSSYNLNLNPTQLQQIETQGVGFDGAVEVSPGTYKLRVVVRDNLNGRIGSVLADLHVN